MGIELGRALRAAREAKGLTLEAVAERLSISYPAVQQWESGKTSPSTNNLMRVASLLEIDPIAANRGEVVSIAGGPDSAAQGQAPEANIRPAPDAPPIGRLMGRGRRVPVYGIAVGGKDGDFRLNGEEVDRVQRPPGLANARDVYALYVSNDSMYPAFREGALVYVNPHRKPVVGDDVIIELHPDADGETGAGFIKRLKAQTPTKIIVEQFNPPRDIEFDRERVRSLHRVVPWEEALGL